MRSKKPIFGWLALASIAFLSFCALINYQQEIADFVYARTGGVQNAAVQAALTGVTLNNGTTAVALGTDITSQTTSLSPDTGAYRWTVSGANFMSLNMPFDNSGSSQTDFSGAANHASYLGGGRNPTPELTTSNCKVGTCMTFDGTDDVLSIADSATVDLDYPFTITAWVNTTNVSLPAQYAFSKWFADHTAGGYIFGIGGGGGVFAQKSNGSSWDVISTPPAISNNTWQHIAWSWDGTTNAGGYRLYVDGSLVTSTAAGQATMLTNSQPLGIGSYIPVGLNAWNGKIDEAQIYPRVLSTTEISQLYTDGLAGVGGPTIIQSEETADTQVWNLIVTPISSSGVIGSPMTSANTATVGAGITLNATAEDETLVSSVGATPSNPYGYQWYVDGSPFMRLNLPLNSGATQTDISGNGYDMTVSGATYQTAGSGNCQVGGCMSFDGNDNVHRDNPGTAFDLSSFTASYWVKTTSSAGFVMTRYQCGGPSGCIVGPSGGAGDHFLAAPSYVWIRGMDTDDWAFCSGLTDGLWHHMVAVRDTSNRRLAIYRDGALCHENYNAGVLPIQFSTNVPFVLGAYYAQAEFGGYASFFTGSIDEPQLLPRALSTAEIQRLYLDGTNATATLRGGPTQIVPAEHTLGQVWSLNAAQVSSTVGSFTDYGSVTITPAAAGTTLGITTPSGTQNQLVTVNYTCQNGDDEPRDLLVEYSTDGGTSYRQASLRSTSTGLISGGVIDGIDCMNATSSNSFVWDTVRDNVASGATNSAVRIRLTAQLAAAPSTTTTNFTVANAVINQFTVNAPVAITSGDTSYENEHIVCLYPITMTVDGTHTFASLILDNGCAMTQTASTSGTVIRTNLTMTGETRITAASVINMNFKGFPAGYTSNGAGGATTTGASTVNKGGAHGGLGGLGASGSNGLTYDSLSQPADPGGGSGANAGGGYVKITTSDFFLTGRILADGASAVCCSGGAGGGIFVTATGSVSGNGSMQANGGIGTDVNNGAGGGGRIAFHYDSSQPGNGALSPTFQAYGGTNAGAVANNLGGAGTIYVEQTDVHVAGQGGVTIDNNNVVTGRSTPIPSGTYSTLVSKNRGLADNTGGTLTITDTVQLTNAGTLIASTMTVTNAVTLVTSSILRHESTTSSTVYRLDVTAGSVSVDATSAIDVDGRGFPAGYTSNGAGGVTTVGASTSNAGGSHGGPGGIGLVGAAAAAYDNITQPVDPGSGSGVEAGSVGLGGGYAKITTGALTLNGNITANGTRVTSTGGGGGGLWIITTGSVSGTGTIRANGADASEINNGAGGGGRIAFYYDSSQPGNSLLSPTFQAFGGNDSGAATSRIGGAGTLYIERTNVDVSGRGAITVDNNSITTSRITPIANGTYGSILSKNRAIAENASGTLTFTDSVTVNNNGLLSASTLTVTNAVTLTNSSVLTHSTTTSSTVYRLNLTSGSLSVDATSSVNADGRGFPAGYTTNGTGGVTSVGASTSNAGGSHAGRGGLGAAGTATAAYDSLTQPTEPGSGSGVEAGAVGLGGGTLKITTGALTLNGMITANGTRVASTGGGGGAIWMIITGSISGTGTIRASGGDSNEVNNGAGGGGRVAFYYDSSQPGNSTLTPTFQAFGGDDPGAATNRIGGAGTLFIKDSGQTNGDLLLSNNNVISDASRATPLFVSVPAGLPTTYTVRNFSVINQAHLLIDTPCAGTPALTVTGITDFSNGGTLTNNQPGSCTVSQASINITTTSLPPGTIGVAYNQTIQSAGGYGPHTFVCRNGGVTVACSTVLPPGLSMSSGGVISGTPTTFGSYPFTVRATEASPGSGFDDQALSIAVGNAPTAPTVLFVHNTDAQLGNTTPSGIDGSPIFSAIFNDPDSSDTATKFRIQVASDAGFTTLLWESGATGTALVSACAQGFRCENINYAGSALALNATTYYWRIKFWDSLDFEGAFSATNQFTTDAAPTAPTTLFSNDTNAQSGLTNPVGVVSGSPVFSAIFHDPDGGDTATQYRVQVDNNNDFSSVLWDSGAGGTNMTSCADGARCDDIVFGGTPLSLDSSIYYWRIKFFDAAGAEGAWSEDPIATNKFTMGQAGGGGGGGTPPPQPTVPDSPLASVVEVIDSTSVRYNWVDVSNNETGFRIINADGQIIADVPAGVTSADETGLPPNSVVDGRLVYAYNSNGTSGSSPFDSVVTAAPVVRPVLAERGGDSVTFTIEPPFASFPGETAVQYEVIVTSPDGTVRNISSGFVQSNSYTFQGVSPEDDVQVRVITRNQEGLQNEPSTYEDVAELSRRFQVSLGVFQKGTNILPRPISAQETLVVRMTLASVGTDPATSVIINMPLPRYVFYKSGTLIVDGRANSDADPGNVANQNGVSASWATVNPGETHTVSFELVFDIEDLSTLREVAAAIVQAAANPLIPLQASVSFSESDAVYMSPVITVEPDVESTVQPAPEEPAPTPTPTPTPEPPAQPPTPEETQTIEQILQQEFPSSQPSAPTEPTLQTGETVTSSDNGSFNITVSGGETILGLSGSAQVNGDSIQFTGTTTEPFTVITLIFNGSITTIVVSDANGFWSTYVDADRLGIAPGEESVVTIEAIAAKGDLRSERVVVGEVTVSRSGSGDIVAEFETTVSESPIITTLTEIQQQVVRVIEKNEPALQTTLTVSAPVILVSSAPLWGYVPYVPTLLFHGFTQLLGFVGRKKRSAGRFYGIAYDSINKQPLALAIIRVYKQEPVLNGATSMGAAAATNKKLVTTVVTDKQGRYDALLAPGTYSLEVAKPGYLFPSQIVSATFDGDFQHVYNANSGMYVEGETLTIPDVPLDPVNKQRQWQLASAPKKLWLTVQTVGGYLAAPVLIVGAIVSALLVMVHPEKVSNWVIAGLYIVLLALQLRLRNKIEKAWGVVYDIATNAVLPLAAVQLIDTTSNHVTASRLSDYQGRFTFLPDPGTYVVKAVKPGFTQVSEVIESPYTDRQPLSHSISIEKSNQQITGDIAMRQQ